MAKIYLKTMMRSYITIDKSEIYRYILLPLLVTATKVYWTTDKACTTLPLPLLFLPTTGIGDLDLSTAVCKRIFTTS